MDRSQRSGVPPSNADAETDLRTAVCFMRNSQIAYREALRNLRKSACRLTGLRHRASSGTRFRVSGSAPAAQSNQYDQLYLKQFRVSSRNDFLAARWASRADARTIDSRAPREARRDT
jgi:hypothetical protein